MHECTIHEDEICTCSFMEQGKPTEQILREWQQLPPGPIEKREGYQIGVDPANAPDQTAIMLRVDFDPAKAAETQREIDRQAWQWVLALMEPEVRQYLIDNKIEPDWERVQRSTDGGMIFHLNWGAVRTEGVRVQKVTTVQVKA